jgi:nucleoside-diphosphate-sugar epimerase
MKVLVTGASGGLGSHLVETFAAAGHRVTGLTRSLDRVAHLRATGADFLVADLRDRATLAGERFQPDCLVHAAATVGGGHSWPEFQASDLQGTANLLEAAHAAGCRRLIHVSSITVYDLPAPGGALDESAPLRTRVPRWDTYTRAKVAVEKQVRAFALENDLALTVLRPSIMLGRHDRNTTPRILRFLASPLAGVIGSGDNRIPCVGLAELAGQVVSLAEQGKGEGRTYNLSGRQGLSLAELLAIHGRLTGRRARHRFAPAIARAAAALLETVSRLSPGPAPPLLDRFMVAVATLDCRVDSSLAAGELGWQGAEDLAGAIALAVNRQKELPE